MPSPSPTLYLPATPHRTAMPQCMGSRPRQDSAAAVARVQPRSAVLPTTQPPQAASASLRVRLSSSAPNYLKPTTTSSARVASSASPQAPPPASHQSSRKASPRSASGAANRRRIPPTNPQQICRLWKDVMSAQPRYMGLTASALRRATEEDTASQTRTRTRTQSRASRSSRSASEQTPGTQVTPPSSEASVSRTAKLETVLDSHAIAVDDSGIDIDVGHHFGVDGLDPCIRDRIQMLPEKQRHGLRNVTVWLNPQDADFIALVQTEYKAMSVHQMNEAEFAACALRHLLPGERRSPHFLLEEGDKCWLPDRLVQPVLRPDGEMWEAPEQMTPGPSTYSWDIRPDCAYWISLQAFNLGFRSKVRRHATVLQDRITCPYFTVEFKKDSHRNATQARNQVAIAACIALYNRWRLKQRSGADLSDPLHQSCIKHYGLTFSSSKWDVWCLTPKTFDRWTGCNMRRLYSGNCVIATELVQLVRWINEINYWALTVHGPGCKDDIATRVYGTVGADTADITALALDEGD